MYFFSFVFIIIDIKLNLAEFIYNIQYLDILHWKR